MPKYYTLKLWKFSVEFRDWRQASVHGGQLAVAALLDQFGLQDRVRREPALDPRRHKGKGFAPSGGQIYTSVPTLVQSTTVGVTGYLTGGQSTAVALQYGGNGRIFSLSHEGTVLGY